MKMYEIYFGKNDKKVYTIKAVNKSSLSDWNSLNSWSWPVLKYPLCGFTICFPVAWIEQNNFSYDILWEGYNLLSFPFFF